MHDDLLPPLLTTGLPGTGGTLKDAPEDFVVEEIPLYPALGVGDHAWLHIEKVGLPTREAVRRIARALDVREAAIGVAGLKDARAVARQWISIEHLPPAAAEGLELPGVRVLEVTAHRNKLRIGHLAGNRFTIRVRGVASDARARLDAILQVLLARGMPNPFGPQRFGVRGDTHRIGLALLRGDHAEAVARLCGRPDPAENDHRVVEARTRFDAGDLDGALAAMPAHFAVERRVLDRLASGAPPREALRAVPRRLARLFVSALQSHLFNRILADRIDDLDRLAVGDLAWIHGKGAVFAVVDPATEQPRCDDLAISPSGPILGRKTKLASGAPGERERAVLEASGLTKASFKVPGIGRFDGERRPLRVPVDEPWYRLEDDDLVIGFVLPRGSYATVLLREITKEGVAGPEDGTADD